MHSRSSFQANFCSLLGPSLWGWHLRAVSGPSDPGLRTPDQGLRTLDSGLLSRGVRNKTNQAAVHRPWWRCWPGQNFRSGKLN